MKYTKSQRPNTGVKVVAGLIVASQVTAIAEEASTPAASKDVVETLEPTTVIATKFEKNLSDVSSNVTVLDVAKLQKEGYTKVQDAIGFRVPGVISTSFAGQRGSVGSLLIRGTKSNQSQLRVDGVRLSDSNLTPGNFLGSTNLFGFSTIELLKGPQGARYGGEAIGGVLGLTSAEGVGSPSVKAYGEFGSFDSYIGQLGAKGQEGDFAYNVNIGYESTDNDNSLPSAYEQLSYSTRFDWNFSELSKIGFTFRGANSEYDTPAAGLYTPQRENNLDYYLTTLFLESQINDLWSTKATLGYYNEDSDSKSSFGPFDTNFEKLSFYWDNQLTWNDANISTIGTFFEHSDYKNSFQDSRTRDVFGLYVNHTLKITEKFLVDGGLRWEDHDDFGDETTWNIGSRYEFHPTWVLKGNLGKGFRTPSFFELFDPFYGNKDVTPETSIGWDLGVEKQFSLGSISATWFESDVEDAILFGSAGYENVQGKSKANGLEVQADSRIDQINSTVYVSYTYLQSSLADRATASAFPKNTLSVGIDTYFTDEISGGINATWVDKARWNPGAVENDDYTLVNLYVNYKLNDNVSLNGRIENLLNEDYSVFSGVGEVPVSGRGRGFYGGVTMTF
jgi:vitamin B12 transporter